MDTGHVTAALDLSRHDRYLLPLPEPGTPVVLPQFVVAMHAHLNARYADSAWPLGPLTANPSTGKKVIHWRNCPTVFADELRLATWTMINGRLRPTFLQTRGNRLRSRLSAAQIHETISCWIRLAIWLESRGIRRLADCTTSVLHSYGHHLLSCHTNRSHTHKTLGAVTRLWAFDQLCARPTGIGQPPWDERGADDYLPAATTTTGENETEPLAEQTMGPLLVWAMRMIDDLAEDILAAWAETQRLTEAAHATTGTPHGKAALEAFLAPLLAEEAPLPASRIRGEVCLAATYLGGITGASRSQIDKLNQRESLAAVAAKRPGPCPLNVPVTGRIAGAPWRQALDFTEAPVLMRHLGTAAFIVCAYLTGMRTGEVLGMTTGCCPDPKPTTDENADGNAGRHLIRTHEYKNAVDADGNHQSAGTERDVPWVAITPVVNAIRVLERMVPDGSLLFDRRVHDVRYHRPGTGSLKPVAIRHRIEDFVAWVNTEAVTHNLPGEAIPADPHGRIGTARFRRSLAWHIARRPNGLVALAIQYGHLRTAVSGAYASRGRGGIHELLDMETVRAVADTVADLHDDLDSGGGVSGPAARRAITAAATAPRFAGTVITARTARRLLVNEDAMIYDNPQAFLLCHYKREQALCHRDGIKDTPSLHHCVPGCGNTVRTDQHAAQLRDRADLLETHARHAPHPVAERLRTNANRLRGYADTHDRTRTMLEDTTG
ncbi:MAG TPA: integrase [Actinophytocola sp.]|uniref:integrase n=1 Tax=Actinophytocola sp. TaxID=1872138 RepID=UPI002DB99ED5|nr:integrase [Actinophytocola sp.]HEU5473771.1 integrase [Actinophytocola sp.]